MNPVCPKSNVHTLLCKSTLLSSHISRAPCPEHLTETASRLPNPRQLWVEKQALRHVHTSRELRWRLAQGSDGVAVFYKSVQWLLVIFRVQHTHLKNQTCTFSWMTNTCRSRDLPWPAASLARSGQIPSPAPSLSSLDEEVRNKRLDLVTLLWAVYSLLKSVYN